MKEIKLTRGYVTQVDDEDFEWLNQWKWHAGGRDGSRYVWRSYRISKTKTKSIAMHRLIMDTPDGMVVDHIDHDGLNNQRSNLRNCTNQQNHMNMAPYMGGKYVGITYDGTARRWVAAIKADGIIRNMGSFKTAEEAAEARDLSALYYFGEFAYLNFPERRAELTERAESFVRNRPRKTSSRYIGVSYYKHDGRWEAYFSDGGKRRWLGKFDTEIEAAVIRDKEAVRMRGASAKLNFPEKINEYLCVINGAKKVLV